ncbi:MAG TPA: ABC transporter substrate-binding protein [Trueperaceae bacterium]
MNRRVLLTTLLMLLPLAGAQTLRVFIGSTLRPDVIGPILEQFTEETGIETELELGGATTDVRQQYLSTVLTSRSGEIDVFLFDVIDPPQYAAAGWAEPLNDYFESEAAMEEFLEPYLDGTVQANLVDGTLYGIPAWTDAQFLYYRADLLEEYGFEPPRTWNELKEQALAIQEGEGDPNLQGFNYQGAAIEGTNCTFLEPLWSAGGDWRDSEGNITVDSPEGRQVLEWYQETLDSGITPSNIAEVATDDSRQQFQAGDVVFMLNWGYAWAHFQGEESQVQGKVGVAPLPAFEGGQSATCVGGFQWAMNPFSENKEAAFELMQYMASEDSQRTLAVQASHIPARESLYSDPAVLEAAPHFEQFYDVIVNARPRPQTEFYTQVSEVIRTSMNGFFAGAMDIDETLETMQAGLEDIFDF